MCLIQQTGISQEQLSVISRFALASVGSQGTVGGLLVAGLVSQTLLYYCTHVISVMQIPIFPFVLVAENGWMACIGWCRCSLWLYLLLRASIMEQLC